MKNCKFFYFCPLKKLVRPETFGPYYVHLLSLLQGKYELTDFFIPPDKLSDEAELGEYKVNFKMNLPSGSCVYSEDLYFEIVNKQ